MTTAPSMTKLMDELAITDVVKKFDRNHRTIQRRINALKDEGLLVPIIKRNTITLYQIFNTEE